MEPRASQNWERAPGSSSSAGTRGRRETAAGRGPHPVRGSQRGLMDGCGLKTQPGGLKTQSGGLKTQSGGLSGVCHLNGVRNPSRGSQRGLQPSSADALPPLSPTGTQSLVWVRAEPPEPPPPQSPSGPPPGRREPLLRLLLSLLRICRSSCSCCPGSASRCGDSMAT